MNDMEDNERIMFFHVNRMTTTPESIIVPRFKWEEEWEEMIQRETENYLLTRIGDETENEPQTVARIAQALAQPAVDYTNKDKYQYPWPLLQEPPEQGGYPQMTTLGVLMKNWDQRGDFDGIIMETLMHFNFSNPKELEMARKFRDADLPFKVTNVPDLVNANRKWTDEYISKQCNVIAKTNGWSNFIVEESSNQYFQKYLKKKWKLETMGLPPSRENDWTYDQWSQHAQYAHAVQLSYDQPHFQVQAYHPTRTAAEATAETSFIIQDLPIFSSPTTKVNSSFMYESNTTTSIEKSLKCRFSESGVVTSVHYDVGGRNFVGMIAGAKRYILLPPTECNKLGTAESFHHRHLSGSSSHSANPRYSYLNFGHLIYLNNDDVINGEDPTRRMSNKERAWLERASRAKAVETVLKAGEVLFIPSFWYHYIIGLQKNIQCNVRFGNAEPTSSSSLREFGGEQDILQCGGSGLHEEEE